MEIISYCGLNCSECPAYIATQSENLKEIKKVSREWSSEEMSFKPEEIYCDGCNRDGRHFIWCSECPIKKCCIEKGYDNCAPCEDYCCDNLKMTFNKEPSAKERLDEIRRNLQIKL